MMARPSLALTVLVLLLLATVSVGKKSKGAKEVAKPKSKTQFSEVVEILEYLAERTCAKVGKSLRKWKKGGKYKERCELFQERVHELGARTGDQLIGALNISSMAEVVQTASGFPYYGQAKQFLKETAEFAFSKAKVTENEIDMELMKQFNQWFLNVVTKQNQQQGMDKITPEMRKMLREKGINVPGMDDDDDDEEDDEDEDDL
eukprot:TRINITY_DN2431_c0_g1_i1.p2 TRINITY_DN2431_c0_g1~~TRINITY_DN2431_c0_g1_i1.p2  ORF type:complete len:204 (-),score=73.83 TRINITY_DN2431_c0_g1_i1:62-673(-)